ncbi:hypothetical protein FOL47_004095 [Perkinsus chesapeaki]|uniref:Uncharacterized protein n=1 Tax=Perkinsus chesapeaki TaxID=330153 RepID=A0A7J6M4K0_PERCH|nr:hypothetical protein FOL47_004095 [Perkinsus chesapeaki]
MSGGLRPSSPEDMASSVQSASRPLLENTDARTEETTSDEALVNRSKCEMIGTLLKLAWPQVVATVLTLIPEVISLSFIGHLGDDRMIAAVGLGNLLLNCTCVTISLGLSSGIDTLVSQAHGRGDPRLAALYINRAVITSSLYCFATIPIAWEAEPILIWLKQDPDIAALSGQYVRGACLGAWPLCLFNCFRKVLNCHRDMYVNMYAYFLVVCLHPLWCWLFVDRLDHGVAGAGLAIATSWTIAFVLLTIYTLSPFCNLPKGTMRMPFYRACWGLHGLARYCHIALPATIMVALDWWSSEIFSMIVGLLHDTAQLAAHVAAANLYNLVYTFTLGLSSAVGILVGISIGKGEVSIAHMGSRCGLIVSLMSGAIIGVVLIAGANVIAQLYAPGQPAVHHYLNYIIPVIAVSMLTSSVQASLAGTCKGLGYQRMAAMSNFKGLYLVMLPLGTCLCLWTVLGVVGAWISRVCGTLTVSIILYRKLSSLDWNAVAVGARARMDRDNRDVKA